MPTNVVRCHMSVAALGWSLLTLNSILIHGQQSTACPSTCPSLVQGPYVEFAEACENNAGDTCYIGCEKGFELVGSCRRTCCMTGDWTGYESRCINRTIQCPALEPPATGSIVDPCLNFAGFTCTYKCNDGASLRGSPTTDCLITGTWSAPTPSCESVQPTGAPMGCYDINPPENGAARGDCVSASTGLVCRFDCDTGYGLVGAPQVVCMGLTWSDVPPTCRPMTCPNLVASANGAVKGSCMPGIVGQSCVFTCNRGFRPINQVIVKCLPSEQWDTSLPDCEVVTCGPLVAAITNGQRSGDGCQRGALGDTCTFRCNDEYAASGTAILRCLNTGTWSGSAPSCVRILCRSIIVDPQSSPGLNTSGDCSPGYGSKICMYFCNPGYQFTDRNVVTSLTCLKNATWSLEDYTPSCQIVQCRRVRIPENSKIACKTAGSECTITCDSGYTTRDGLPSSVIKCLGSTYDKEPDECLRVTCRPLKGPVNGSASAACLSGLPQEKCTFYCNENFTPPSVDITCGKNGVWSKEPPPTCRPITCPANAQNGVIANGVRTGLCTVGNAGQSCVYSCNDGYALVGNPSIRCKSDGMWSSRAPVCVQVTCPPLPAQVPASTESTDTTDSTQANGWYVDSACGIMVGAACKPICSAPDLLPDKAILICSDSGQWEPREKGEFYPIIVCMSAEFTPCDPEQYSPENGRADGDCNPGKLGGSCTFSCLSGFKLIGPMEMKCVQDNSQNLLWSPQSPPICRAIGCPSLQAPSNGISPIGECTPGQIDDTCTFRCNEGYKLKGEGQLRCSPDGTWSSNPPVCTREDCPALVAPQPGGSLQGVCQPGRAGEICLFFCPPGLVLFGATNILCEQSGNWNGVVPTCQNPNSTPAQGTRQPRTDSPDGSSGACPSLTAPRGGSMSGTCAPGKVGRTCYIMCPPGSRGSDTVSCQSNGSWFPSPPTCSRGRCPRRRRCCSQVVAPRFGRIMDCNLEVGGKCRMSCNSGYSPTVRGPLTCMRNRRWNMNVTQLKCNQRQATTRSPRFWLRRPGRRGK